MIKINAKKDLLPLIQYQEMEQFIKLEEKILKNFLLFIIVILWKISIVLLLGNQIKDLIGDNIGNIQYKNNGVICI